MTDQIQARQDETRLRIRKALPMMKVLRNQANSWENKAGGAGTTGNGGTASYTADNGGTAGANYTTGCTTSQPCGTTAACQAGGATSVVYSCGPC